MGGMGNGTGCGMWKVVALVLGLAGPPGELFV